MVIFEIFLKTKSDQNIHQNAPNCTILKKFIGGACPRTSLTKLMASPGAACRSLRDMQIPKSEKKIHAPPPAKSWGRPCYTTYLGHNSSCMIRHVAVQLQKHI